MSFASIASSANLGPSTAERMLAMLDAEQDALLQMHLLEASYPNKKGVHWFWYAFWLIFFFPAILVLAIVHHQRWSAFERYMDAARMRTLKAALVKKTTPEGAAL